MDVFPDREDQAGEDHGLTHFYMAREKYVDAKVFNLLGLSSPIFFADELLMVLTLQVWSSSCIVITLIRQQTVSCI